MTDLEAALRTAVRGEVGFDVTSRALTTMDASNYRRVPLGVVAPRDADDVAAVLEACRARGVPVVARGGGTSIAGQATGTGVVLDFTRHMNRLVSLDRETRTAVVQPGLVLDRLQRAAAPHGLRFGPDPSTHSRCTLGGMIGNNSCGSHSVAWGTTADSVRELTVLTARGERLRLGQEWAGAPEGLRALVDGDLARLRTGFPDLPRRISGYALDALLPEKGADVARSFCGSEGTLGVLTEAVVRLVEAPRARALAVLGYADESGAAEAAAGLLPLGPLTVEGMAVDLVPPASAAGLPRGGAWLFVETGGDTAAEARARAEAVVRAADIVDALVVTDPAGQRALWRIREDASGTATRMPDGSEAWPGWEDCAVPPVRLGAYLRDFRALLSAHGLRGTPYGHFGDGCIHVRIDFDLLTDAGVARFRRFSEELADVVVAHGGSLSGEHGDGQARAELLPRMYGEETVALFERAKAVWDPDDLLNPGMLVRPAPLDANLRFSVLPREPVDVAFGYPSDGGDFSAAVRRCVGVAKCRTTSAAGSSVMCPSFRATGEEEHSTRGRARLLHEMLAGELVTDGWRSTEVRDALDLCLSCKGCRSDCPVEVDMATYKAEFLHHHYAGRRRPAAHYAMGWLPVWLRWASLTRTAPIVNALSSVRPLAAVAKRLGGIAGEREVPRLAGETFSRWWRRGRRAGDGRAGAGAGAGAGVGPGTGCRAAPVERAAVVRELAGFAASRASVLGLVGAPGSGRTTELAALASRRALGAEPAPTLWLRGADLRDDDMSLADAARRALARAARIIAASDRSRPAGLGDITPDRLAHLARTAGRPLLLLLDGPEEMPPVLAHRLPEWTEGTVTWLRDTGTRLVVACRAEYWERAGAEFPRELLYGAVAGAPASGPVAGVSRTPGPAAGEWPSGRVVGVPSPRAIAAGEPWPGLAGGGGHSGADGGVPLSGAAFGEPCAVPVSGVSLPASGGEVPSLGTPLAAAPGESTTGSAGRASTSKAAPFGAAGAAPRQTGPIAGSPTVGSPTSWTSAPPVRSEPAEPRSEAPGADIPPCVRLGDLGDDEAREARARYRLPEGALADPDGRHPLTLRLLAEVHDALPGSPPPARVERHAVFAAYLDLACLRVANRLATANGLHGTAVRRLAAKVSGQVHEAARRSLGPGQGELDRESFEALFPWGPAPARLGGGTGWATAVLGEGLLVPAGSGYRFAHEELADWIQGTHLDLDEALRALVHHRGTPHDTHTHTLPVPHHRIGPVVEALLLLARQYGIPQLALTLEELVHALDADPHSWWAVRLLAEVLTRVPDATPYTEVLRLLADGIVERSGEGRAAPGEFGPAFWTAVRLPEATRLDLLRRLVLADGPPHEPGPRHLDTVAGRLAADPTAVQPLLVRWFDDERPLPATPHATVATAAQALLHTHRHRGPGGLDGLTEVLVDSAHRRADELLAVLAEEEPSALCRAVERWARDERPARRTAAVTHGLRTAPHARTGADRTLLRHAALVLLADPADSALRGGALALLVQDPGSRDRHLPRALSHFAAGDPYLPPSAVAAALPTHPGPVLDAFRARLRGPDAGEALRRLADATTPALARRVAVLVGEAVVERPETAGHVAAYVDRRLDRDPAARAVLHPLVTGLLDDGPEPVRAALAGVLAGDGTPGDGTPGSVTPDSGPLRRELREHLLAHEQDPAVLDALLHAAARCGGDDLPALVHRTGLLLVRTPDGATRFDRGLVDLARHLPGFATRVTGWLADEPQDWAALVGPSARRTIENLAGARVPA